MSRRILVLVILTWLPLLLLTLREGFAYGRLVKIPLLYDFALYGRFILALPLLIVAEAIIDPGIRVAISEFVESGIVPDAEIPKFERILQRVKKLRDSALPEIAFFVLAFFPTFFFQHEWTAGAVSSWHTTASGLTAAGWWFAVLSAPILRFVIYRWTFRYFVWGLLLWRISRLRLVLVPTHPDHSAGLQFLSMSQKHFGILFCAFGCIFAGRVANSIVFEGVPLTSFKSLILGFIVLSVILGLLPLVLLVPRLKEVRKMGLLEYGRLANQYSKLFDRKWVHRTEQAQEPMLGSGDIQSLADMGNSFGFVDSMRIAPISKRLVFQLASQAIVPLVPVIVLGTPTPELMQAVMKMMI
ncbi:MAG TPA: hypothetical protein VMS18_16440 [Candidatus Binatia bacterium]|nr:hypothetical protein [Candidatus Binatia bacterium]